MHNLNKIRSTLALALSGAGLFWLLAMMGCFEQTQPTTTFHVISSIVYCLGGALWGYLFTRDKSAIAQMSAVLANFQRRSVMRSFYIVDDYTSECLWDYFINEEMAMLPSKPRGWQRAEARSFREGSWELGHAMHNMASTEAYAKAGFWKPKFEQLPAIFCVHEDGKVDFLYNAKPTQTREFVAARIA